MTREERKQKIRKILSLSSKDVQVEKAKEELNELAGALQLEDIDNIAEEIADVLIVIGELRLLYQIPFEYIVAIIDYKIERTISRLERKNKEEKNYGL